MIHQPIIARIWPYVTPTRPLPPHGTESRYNGRAKCRCLFCRHAAALARSRRYRRRWY